MSTAPESNFDTAHPEPVVVVEDLRMAYERKLIQKDVSFTVNKGQVFIIMGGSGCGKSTLLKHMVGLQEPLAGSVRYGRLNFWDADAEEQDEMRKRFGVLFQSGALFSTLTLAENVMMPLALHGTQKNRAERHDRAMELLELMGLAEAADLQPSEISGGMRKRAGLARALALDPEILFLDEPSAGLDPISSRKLDDLILSLRDRTGAAIVVVTHELQSLFAIGDSGIFLDAESKRPIAYGSPKYMLENSDHPFVQAFLKREVPLES